MDYARQTLGAGGWSAGWSGRTRSNTGGQARSSGPQSRAGDQVVLHPCIALCRRQVLLVIVDLMIGWE